MLKQISDRIWIDPPGGRNGEIRPTVGVIRAENQTVLVDPGNSPAHARRLKSEITRLGLPPVSIAIYTHHHWDHVFGASVFGVPVLAHELCRELLTQQAAYPWSDVFLVRAMEDDPRLRMSYTALRRAMATCWREFQVIVPTLTFADQYSLHVDDLELQLQHVGGNHAPDSIIIDVLQEHVTFIGDCYYRAPASSGGRSSLRDSIGMLLALLAKQKNNLYIDGHMVPLRSSPWIRSTLRVFSQLVK
jgi:glyoxylase-like metal-dependent hydrolase (beta-lactamase superfamily II)